MAIALYIMMVFFNFPLPLYPIIIIPIFISVNGLSEAKNGFCTSYGLNGKYNMTSEVGITQDVLSRSKRELDKKYANKILFGSLKISLLLSIILIALSRVIN